MFKIGQSRLFLTSGGHSVGKATRPSHVKDSREVTGIMLSAMIPSLQKQFEGLEAYDILNQLKELFHKQAKLEHFETQVSIIEMKLEKGKPVSPHVLKMIGLFERMDGLGYKIPEETCIDLLLYSLHDGYKQFRLHYNMSDQNKSLHEMHAMLKTAELDMKDSSKSDVMYDGIIKDLTFSNSVCNSLEARKTKRRCVRTRYTATRRRKRIE